MLQVVKYYLQFTMNKLSGENKLFTILFKLAQLVKLFWENSNIYMYIHIIFRDTHSRINTLVLYFYRNLKETEDIN